MADAQSKPTFIIDCHVCRAKVAAAEIGRATWSSFDDEAGEPFNERVLIGKCPKCKRVLVGTQEQVEFEGYNSNYEGWADVVRVYPNPPKSFFSSRIPKVVAESLDEAARCLQAGLNRPACVSLGRALEALCNDVLNKKVPLGQGIKLLKEQKYIEERLYDWSQHLRAFRNLAAHAEEASISRQDADDLQTFVISIVEYVYDLSDRYQEFKDRLAAGKEH